MKLISGTLAFLTIFAGYSFSQSDASDKALCTNQTVEKIESRGIKVGMKIEDILNIFASDEEEKEKLRQRESRDSYRRHLGFESISLRPQKKDTEPGKRFEDIVAYGFEFLDERVLSFTVYYQWTNWKDSKQFAEKVSESLNLPGVDNWTIERSQAQLNCGDYLIIASYQGNSRFEVRNMSESKIFAERVEKHNEETRKRFRP